MRRRRVYDNQDGVSRPGRAKLTSHELVYSIGIRQHVSLSQDSAEHGAQGRHCRRYTYFSNGQFQIWTCAKNKKSRVVIGFYAIFHVQKMPAVWPSLLFLFRRTWRTSVSVARQTACYSTVLLVITCLPAHSRYQVPTSSLYKKKCIMYRISYHVKVLLQSEGTTDMPIIYCILVCTRSY